MTRTRRQLRAAAIRRRNRRRLLSPLTRRILVINLLAPAILVVGLFYLDQYRRGLVDARFDSLFVQAQMIAGALGEAALADVEGGLALDPEIARPIVRRLAATTDTRVRLFGETGETLADSRRLAFAGRDVIQRALPPPARPPSMAERAYQWIYDRVNALIPADADLPPYRERPAQRADDYSEAVEALVGEPAWALRSAGDGRMILSVAVPVQGLRRVLGAVMLSTDSADIDDAVRAERFQLLKLFGLALVVTVLLSLYLAGAIGRPVRRLAEAADKVRTVHSRRIQIPDFSSRRDEIGDLSAALKDMTEALYRRMDAIESFAADVAHEIKNPLTSLRSAVESFGRTHDPEKQQRLIGIIQDDVHRLDRLISDISAASRLDAELSRAEFGPVDIGRLAAAVVEVYRETARANGPRFELALPESQNLTVPGIADRLGQVLRNLIDNAISFSPPGGRITLAARRDGDAVEITVEDEGPGIPEENLETIFERFYTERPSGEAFGTHSGLGLSICRQIVEAFGGAITAENRTDDDGRIVGARFLVRLPT